MKIKNIIIVEIVKGLVPFSDILFLTGDILFCIYSAFNILQSYFFADLTKDIP